MVTETGANTGGRQKGTPKTGGRKKGAPNKLTVKIREALLLAAEQEGEDGKGKDGLVGYMKMVARTDIKTFCALISRTIPTTVEDKSDPPQKIIIEHKYAPDPKQRAGT